MHPILLGIDTKPLKPEQVPSGQGSFFSLSDTTLLGIAILITSAWAFFSWFVFNGLASQLFFLLTTYLIVLSFRFKVTFHPVSATIFILFVASTALSAQKSGEFWPALASNTHWFVLPVAVTLLAQVFRTHEKANDIIRIACAASIVYYLARMYLDSDNYIFWRFVPVFGSIRHLGMTMGFLALILYSARATSIWEEIFFRSVRISALCLVFWSGSRTPMLAWIIGIAIIAYGNKTQLKTLLIDTGVAFFFAIALPKPYGNLGLLGAIDRVTKAASLDSLSSSRITLWQSAITYLVDNNLIWWGAGGNGYIRIQTLWGGQLNPPGHIHPHNFFIQALCEWGVIGTSVFMAFIGCTLYRINIKEVIHTAPVAVSGVAYIVITGMLDATLYHLEHLIYLMMALAICLSRVHQHASKAELNVPRSLIWVVLAALLVPHLMSAGYRINLPWYFPTR